MTYYLFRPIETIIDYAMSKIQKRMYQPKMISSLLQQFLSVQIVQLYQSCYHFHKLLESLSFTKSKQCEEIENLQYPTLKEEIYSLGDSINFRKIKFIKQIFVIFFCLKFKNWFQNQYKKIRILYLFRCYSKKKCEHNLEHYYMIKNIVRSALLNKNKQ